MLLVTGITGHTGKFFLQELIKNNYEGSIRCVIRNTSDTSSLDNSGLNVEKVVGDLNDSAFIEQVMSGVDTVMHIFNIWHSVNIVKAAIKCGAKRVILVHTTGIFSKFKLASEDYKNIEEELQHLLVEAPNLNVVILRPTMIYGDFCDHNISKFIKMVDKLRVIPVIDKGSGLIQPVNARDLGKAYYQVITNPEIKRGDYILSGEKPITMLEMLKLISENLGKKTTFISVPPGFGVSLARILKVISLGKVDYIEKVQRMSEDRSYTHEAAVRDFGYRVTPFAEGIKIEVQQYKRNHG